MSWQIKSKDNTVRAIADIVEYNDKWMEESYVSATIESPTPIDFQIGDYVIYREERFEINYDPGKIKSAERFEKGDAFKYEGVKFNSLDDELTRCDFLDVVSGDNGLHFTGLPKFTFYGGVRDLAMRIQANLDRAYGKNVWKVTVSSEYADTTEKNISVDTIKVKGALEMLVNDFKTYYTTKGRTVTIGAAGVPADHIFKYGKGNGLYELEQNAEADQAIVTRVRAYGSTRNIPHRYYNSLTGADGKALIPDNMAVQYLMLPDFPYKTQDPYIDSKNITALGVREGTIFFDGSNPDLPETYPSLEGMTAEQLKAAGVACASSGELDVLVGAEQMSDNGVGKIDGDMMEGSVTTEADPPTFKVTLKDIGFDINDHLTTDTATLSFKSGKLGARDFEIVGCEKNGDNYVLELNRVFDEDIKLWFPYKDYNAAKGDKFVLLNIKMPEVYIKAASQKLKDRTKEWLAKNDYSRSIYAPKIDEIFMARQHDAAMASNGAIKSLHDTLTAGMQLLFEDADLGIDAAIFIDTLTIREGEGPIPTYDVVLKEEKTVGRLDKMQNQIDSLAAGQGQGSGGYTASQIRNLISAYGGAMFLSKLKDDRTPYRLTSDTSFDIGDFLAGVSGARLGIDKEDGKTFLEVDNIYARVRAYFEQLTIIDADTVAGRRYITPGGSVKCSMVEETDTAYRCYFLSEQDGEKTETYIKTGDQAIAEMFNAKTGTANSVSNHRWWRLVTDVQQSAYIDDAGNVYGYIEVSKSDCEAKSDIPQEGDVICQLGSRNDTTRQAAMVFDTVGSNAPSVTLLTGIDSYSLAGKDIISYGYDKTKGNAFFNVYGDTYIGDRDGSTFIKYDRATNQLDIKARISASSTIGDKSLEDFIDSRIPDSVKLTEQDILNLIGGRLDSLQDQIDGAIETWYYDGVPTLANAPANQWQTEEDREAHSGDLYYDKTSGFAYRFQKDGSAWKWVLIQDSSIAEALGKAKDAQDTADGKMKVFATAADTLPSAPYQTGDIWVNANYTKDGKNYSNDILRCVTARTAKGTEQIADWTLASKYTDDSALNAFIADYDKTIADIQGQVDGKAETWYQASDPSTAWKTDADKAEHIGDLWYCTQTDTAKGYEKDHAYYWDGAKWVESNAPQSVFDAIDGKADIYVSKPSAYNVNDLWFLEADYGGQDTLHPKLGNPSAAYKAGTLMVATASSASFNAAHWAKKDRYTDDTLAQTAYDDAQKTMYLTQVLPALQDQTVINGGLMLSTLLKMGQNNGTALQKTWSGISGIYDPTQLGNGIGSWWGGDSIDLFNADGTVKTGNAAKNAATALVRMDGSAYFANGNVGFNADGSGWLGSGTNKITFKDGAMTFGSGILINVNNVDGLADSLSSLENFANRFIPVDKDGNTVAWTSPNLYAVKLAVGFYSESFISAKGASDTQGAGGGIIQTVHGINDLTKTFATESLAETFSAYAIASIASRVTALEGKSLDTAALSSYLTANNYAKKSDIPASMAWSAITDKPSTFAPSAHSHPQSEITDLTKDLSAISSRIAALEYLKDLFGVDSNNDVYVKSDKGFYTTSFISAKGKSNSTGAGGVDAAWLEREGYAKQSWVTQQGYLTSSSLSGLASASHTHAQSDITDLTTDLAGKLAKADVKTLTFSAGKFSDGATSYAVTAAKTVNIPTKTSHIQNDSDFTTNAAQKIITDELAAADTELDTRIKFFEDIFGKDADGNIYIKTKKGFYTEGFISAKGKSDNTGGGSYSLVRKWTEFTTAMQGDGTEHALGSNLGWDLKSNKADASALSAHVNDSAVHFTQAERTKLAGIAANANNYTYTLPKASTSALGGIIVGDRLSIDANGKLSATYTYTHPASGVTAGSYAKVTVDANGHVTAGAGLAAADIPNLDWSKITSGKPTTLAGYGITNAYTKTETDNKFLTVATFETYFKMVDGNIKAMKGLFTESFLSAKGSSTSTSGGISSDWLDQKGYATLADTRTSILADVQNGYSPIGHTHSAADITSGTLALARIPTGTGASQVALGNHTHSNYLTAHQSLANYVTLDGAQTISGAKTFTSVTNFSKDAVMTAEKAFVGYEARKAAGKGGWAYHPFRVHDVAGTDFAHFGVYGVSDTLNYIYLGANAYDSWYNLRVSPTGEATASKFIKTGGTSSQFLKADGSVDGTAYLPLTGGTINTTSRQSLNIIGATGGNYISFGLASVIRGHVGRTNDSTFIQNDDANSVSSVLKITDTHALTFCPTGSTYYNVWHAGNDGSGSGLDADLLDGLHEHNFLHVDKFIACNENSIYDLRFNIGSYDREDFRGGQFYGEYPSPYGMFLSIVPRDRNSAALIFIDSGLSGGDAHMHINTRKAGDFNTQFDGWKKVAYVSDNVASASKLATARSIWGQSFDGSGNVSGNMTGVGSIFGTASAAPYLQCTSSPTAAGSLGGAVGIGSAPYNYGIFVWGEGSGKGHIQVGRKDGTDTAYNLILQEFGGNVGIGTTAPSCKLDVNGDMRATGQITSNYASNSWFNGVTKAVLNCTYTGYGAIFNAATLTGRISLSTYPKSNDVVYLGFIPNTVTSTTASLERSLKWHADTGRLDADSILIGGDNGVKLSYDSATQMLCISKGVYSNGAVSAKGASTTSSSGGGLITAVYNADQLNGSYVETANDTFNAHAIQTFYKNLSDGQGQLTGQTTGLNTRVTYIEGKYMPFYTKSVSETNGTNLGWQGINIENGNLISGYKNYWNVLNLGSYSGGNYRTQMAMPYQNDIADTDLFIRSANNTTWRDWRRVLHSGNFGSYALPLAGGTMTGDIILGSNNYIYGANETGGAMVWWDGSRTVLGSRGTSSTKATHLRSSTGHATIGDGEAATYNILDSGNYTDYAAKKAHTHSDYASTTHNHDSDYLKLAGGTVTGNLTINGSTTHVGSISTQSTISATNNISSSNGNIYATNGNIYATAGSIGVSQTAGSGKGIFLYGGSSNVTNYGILFGTTANFGKHGSVTGDWATYFTMTASADTVVNRGWVFRNTVAAKNVASISMGGDMTLNGTLSSPLTTTNHINGNRGVAIINSTASAGAYTMLAKLNSTNGYFTEGVYGIRRILVYTKKTTVDAGTNAGTYYTTLMDENGCMVIGSINVTTTDYKLYVNGVAYAKTGVCSDGYVSAKGTSTSSDARLKSIVAPVSLAVEDVARAEAVRFDWRDGGGRDVGSIAQTWQRLLPEAVRKGHNGFLTLDYGKTALIAVIQTAKRVVSHEERIARLEEENANLRKRLAILENSEA